MLLAVSAPMKRSKPSWGRVGSGPIGKDRSTFPKKFGLGYKNIAKSSDPWPGYAKKSVLKRRDTIFLKLGSHRLNTFEKEGAIFCPRITPIGIESVRG
jgi:hypothetical protein